ncbi:DUF4136 domain-containing protein [Rhizorhabdus dicambivorans]|uniref:DUF4136 domain-containing protein n=1 Tax=Rhizorhabdus dicambivorans TaxID=1850238 RepID=A0A2A4G170_9SPHN|nr:DUF4136 domain-containing protein [Rhizorhabdus dicambivorans]ATE66754.1 DUF4136 domain-containing protein [Rhizorhabdus dicambivorans]PCE43759.1 DUF4136 domain-containing protein [Rhizorhabdus dicambivorans]
MPILRKLLAVAAPIALLAVSACTQPFEAKVSRFQALPVPEGQTFTVIPTDARNQGGLEFAQYASLVTQRLAAYGYRPVDGAGQPELVVKFDYGVDKGTPKVVSRPSIGPAFGPWGYGGFGPYGRRWGYGSAFYYGWDPFFYDPWYRQDIDTYTVYTSWADMTIERVSDGKHLFEGKARARSLDDALPRLVPNLVEAMFTNFPGNSGEEVKITVAPPDKRK